MLVNRWRGISERLWRHLLRRERQMRHERREGPGGAHVHEEPDRQRHHPQGGAELEGRGIAGALRQRRGHLPQRPQDLAFWLDDPKQSKVVGKWAFIPNGHRPAASAAGFFEGWGFRISKYSKHPDAAAKVLEVMFDFPVQKDFNLSQGPVQANMNVYTDPDVIKNNPHMPEIKAVASTAIPPIPSPKFTEIASILAGAAPLRAHRLERAEGGAG